MKPGKRRKTLTGLISRTAQELESKYLLSFDDQRSVTQRQQDEMRRIVEEDPVQGIHTLGMWRWLEKSGHFGRITDGDIRWRLDSCVSPSERDAATQLAPTWSIPALRIGLETSKDAVAERLQSLLFEEDIDEPHDDADSDDDIGGLYEHVNGDFSKRAINSTLFKELDALGLKPDVLPLQSEDVGTAESSQVGYSGSMQFKPGDSGNDLGEVTHSMIEDLQRLNGVNNQRTAFLESVATLHRQSELSGTKADDPSLIARYQQLLRKTKEAKGKNGKLKNAKKDEFSLPW
jgi:hypothetical protein